MLTLLPWALSAAMLIVVAYMKGRLSGTEDIAGLVASNIVANRLREYAQDCCDFSAEQSEALCRVADDIDTHGLYPGRKGSP